MNWGWVAAAMFAVGCASGGREAVPASRDSAGVRIVESSRPAWGSDSGWRIEPKASLDIGSADGGEPYLFNYVETALRLGDGTIVVANAGSGELRFFDSAGRHVRSVGRNGSGPGEFGQSSVHIWRAPNGDIVADDAGNRRVNIFDSAQTFRATVTLDLPPTGLRPSLQGVLADGSWLVQAWVEGARSADGEWRRTSAYHRYGSDGKHLATLAQAPEALLVGVSEGKMSTFISVPFAPSSFAAAQATTILLNDDGAPRLMQLAGDGAIRSIYRWQVPRRKGADLIEAYRNAEVARISDTAWKRRTRGFLSHSMPIPEFVPAYSRMIVDYAGNIWLQRYYLASEEERINDILAPDGRWLGTVTLPPGLWVLQVGPDFLLGWRRDESDVEHVVVHRLRKGTQ